MINAYQPKKEVLRNLEQNQSFSIKVERTILEQKLLEIDYLYSQFCGSKLLQTQNKEDIQAKIEHIDSVYIQIKQHNQQYEQKKRSQRKIKHHDNEFDFIEERDQRFCPSEKENKKILPLVEEEMFADNKSKQIVALNKSILKVEKKYVKFSSEKEEKERNSLGITTTAIVKVTPKKQPISSNCSNLKSQIHQTEGTYVSIINQTSCRKMKKQLEEEQSFEEKERTLEISQTHLSPLKKSFLEETIQSSLRKNVKKVAEPAFQQENNKNFKQSRCLLSLSSEKYKAPSKGNLRKVYSKSSINSRVNSLEKQQSRKINRCESKKTNESTNQSRVQYKTFQNDSLMKNEKNQSDNTKDSDKNQVLKSNYYAHKWLNKSFDRERKQTDIEFINSLYERANSAQALLK